ncbi:MAG: ABC transporter ATP-binding protein [Dehalococcoidia bacterium]
MEAEHALVVKDLHVGFELRRWGFGRAGVVRAVDGVSLTLEQGEAAAVVGESGCGKSTLARTILGLYRPARGQVVFEGRRLEGLGAREMRWYRSQVGYVQQDPYGALPPFMSVRRILAEPLVVNKVSSRAERARRIRESLEEVKLTPVEDFLPKFPHMLSGGQQQRLVIARAMVMQPRLLVADEPVSMLDASVRVEILELLQSLQRLHNLMLLYITHDLSTTRYFVDRVLVMYAGRIVEQSAVEDLVSSPLHPYTRALLAAIPDPDPENATTFKDVPLGEPPNMLHPPSGCRFHPRCPAFIQGLCEVEEPPEFEPEPGHLVACWLYRDEQQAL